ncbi:MAG: AAA family ATPase [Salinivirgaceae bacterium]|nr:AAA family ATPase [Salinivirgaceae bacterium]
MDGFKNIEIKNFRGIDHLTIDDCSRVNVFLGQNGSGKSSILEALLMIAGMSNPELPRNINMLRSKGTYGHFLDVRYMFHNLMLMNPPEISTIQTKGAKRHLTLKMPFVFDEQSQTTTPIGQIQRSDAMVQVNQVEMNFDITEDEIVNRYKSTLSFNQQGPIRGKIADGYQEKMYASLIPANIPTGNSTSDLSELVKRKMKQLVVDRLVYFDNRITTIEVLSDGVFVGIEGVPELLPVTMHGDGMFRYLTIVAASANPISDVVLIDEIENGLHYSAYKKLWEAIFALATETNKQIFITTHSKETLYRLNEMLEEKPCYQDALRLYTIENTKLKGQQAYKYSFEELNAACKNGVEIRSLAL